MGLSGQIDALNVSTARREKNFVPSGQQAAVLDVKAKKICIN
jgi:hypothetical protein